MNFPESYHQSNSELLKQRLTDTLRKYKSLIDESRSYLQFGSLTTAIPDELRNTKEKLGRYPFCSSCTMPTLFQIILERIPAPDAKSKLTGTNDWLNYQHIMVPISRYGIGLAWRCGIKGMGGHGNEQAS